ncbi:hypothetical protein SAMN05660337_1227 [Maridesulfovibrio ferrireducens]|uniref:Uncharacterized protein n=1 Tax=Maridesulfovibrio ferrireducens TaxID=246191 RepID=A0A1G9EQJ5_9BACT|nr:hypothetical protein [Maridesulfovibrio ferrireducens]SDK78487.1 hypothetical protein SAMN05660337_1227 [Maridesulfovibrio ferrireducens]
MESSRGDGEKSPKKTFISTGFQTWANELVSLGKNFYWIVLTIGILILWGYYFSIHYYPVGISVDEVFLFLGVSFGFGALYLFGVAYSYIACMWLFRAFVSFSHNKKLKDNYKNFYQGWFIGKVFILISILLSCLLGAILLSLNGNNSVSIGLFVVQGCFLNHYFVHDVKELARDFSRKYLLLLISLPLLALPVSGVFIDSTFSLLGIRKENVSVYVDAKYNSVLDAQRIAFSKTSSPNNVYIEKCVVHSTGVGTKSYLEFWTKDNVSKKIALPTKDLIFVDG